MENIELIKELELIHKKHDLMTNVVEPLVLNLAKKDIKNLLIANLWQTNHNLKIFLNDLDLINFHRTTSYQFPSDSEVHSWYLVVNEFRKIYKTIKSYLMETRLDNVEDNKNLSKAITNIFVSNNAWNISVWNNNVNTVNHYPSKEVWELIKTLYKYDFENKDEIMADLNKSYHSKDKISLKRILCSVLSIFASVSSVWSFIIDILSKIK